MADQTEKEGALIERIFRLVASNTVVAGLIFSWYLVIKFSNMVEGMTDKFVKLENDRLTFEKQDAMDKLNQSKKELAYKYKIPENDSTK